VLEMDSHRISRVRVAPAESDAEYEDEDEALAASAGETDKDVDLASGEELLGESTAAGPMAEEGVPERLVSEEGTPTERSVESENTGTNDVPAEADVLPKPIPITSKQRPKRR